MPAPRTPDQASLIGHTPGPWSFDGPAHNVIVWGPEADQRVCFMTSDGAAEANARLISAAPDLLAALQYVWDAYGFDPSIDSAIWQTVLAARAKATGA